MSFSGVSSMQRRGFFLAGLAGLFVAAAPASAKLGNGLEAAPDMVEPAQYGGPRGRRFRRRCRLVQRRVVFRDRFGRLRERIVEREVCR